MQEYNIDSIELHHKSDIARVKISLWKSKLFINSKIDNRQLVFTIRGNQWYTDDMIDDDWYDTIKCAVAHASRLANHFFFKEASIQVFGKDLRSDITVQTILGGPNEE